ncbi:MAG: hypothetical protein ACYTHM_25760 [Planctomycetota bacterium]|jgi:hypothetical protein
MKRSLLLLLALILVAGGCVRESEEPIQGSGDSGPGLLGPGSARFVPDKKTVPQNGILTVYIDVATGNEVLGAFSARVTYNQNAFQLVTVDGTDPVIGNPFHHVETTPGDLYIGCTNTAPPDMGLTGERRVVALHFQVTGGPGESLQIAGDLLAMGDTAFPAQAIGSGAFPRSIEVVHEVLVE